MKLDKKKQLAARTLGVGKGRIYFSQESLVEIKEAITKQDIKDLFGQGVIKIKSEKGRKKIERRKSKRKAGKIKRKVKTRKKEYVRITRKLRRYVSELRKQGKIDRKKYLELRKKIKAKAFKSMAQLKEYLGEAKK